MKKNGNYRKADDIRRCANCKHHYKVSRADYIMCNEGNRVIRVSKNYVCDMWEMADPRRYLFGRIT
jgi:hypothetical protein